MPPVSNSLTRSGPLSRAQAGSFSRAPKWKAVIFDLDGTLVDNMPHHLRAWLELCAALGISMTEAEVHRRFGGKKNDEILPALVGRSLSAAELARLAEEKEARYRELYRPDVTPLAGLMSFLARLDAADVPCAVGTSAPAANRAMVLEALGLAGRFGAVIGEEHAAHGKPSPDLFLAAAAALRVEPASCLVFEDATNGVRAARNAGMACVGVTTTTDGASLVAAGAGWAIPDYRSLPDELDRRLFA